MSTNTETDMSAGANAGQIPVADVHAIRTLIARHINDNFSGVLPLEWENMPAAPRRATDSGWVHVGIVFGRFEKLGLGGGGGNDDNASPGLQRGRVRIVIAVAGGRGTGVLDNCIAEMTGLLAGKRIGGIALGASQVARPAREHGYHRTVLEVGFAAITMPAPAPA